RTPCCSASSPLTRNYYRVMASGREIVCWPRMPPIPPLLSVRLRRGSRAVRRRVQLTWWMVSSTQRLLSKLLGAIWAPIWMRALMFRLQRFLLVVPGLLPSACELVLRGDSLLGLEGCDYPIGGIFSKNTRIRPAGIGLTGHPSTMIDDLIDLTTMQPSKVLRTRFTPTDLMWIVVVGGVPYLAREAFRHLFPGRPTVVDQLKVLAELIAAAGEAEAKSLKVRISTAAKTRWEMPESIQEANVLGENDDTIDLEIVFA